MIIFVSATILQRFLEILAPQFSTITIKLRRFTFADLKPRISKITARVQTALSHVLSIRPQADHNEDTWAEGFRTDYVRWLFNRDSRSMLDIAFKAVTNQSDTAPCRLRIWVRVSYARGQLEPAPILITTVDLDGKREWHVNVSTNLKEGLEALNKYPAEERGVKLELLPPSGQPTLLARRQLISLRMTNRKRRSNIEHIHFYEQDDSV